MKQNLLDLCQSLLEADSAETFQARLERAVYAMEFEHFGGAVMLDENAAAGSAGRFIEFENVSSKFDGYLDPGARKRDPVMQAVRRSSLPVVWNKDTYYRAGLGDLGDQVAQWGIKCGITMAMHLPGGRHISMGVATSRILTSSDVHCQRAMAELSLLTAYAYEAGERLFLATPDLNVSPLSGRERECLQWTAAGKTAWETSIIMSIAESTVNKHLTSAIEKLGCSNKAHAVAKALQAGWLAI